uniref:Uncharacterized protein n=1 Tax=Brassica oleracea var. oleracea TaxID=109376 RepID=A0A0D3CC01_BRAOL
AERCTYGERILGSSSEYVQSNITRYFFDPRYYFQVNDQYVRNKLKVVLFPFLHRRHWTRISEPVGGRLSYKPPIYDINAPDLYIPFMAFGTYVVLADLSPRLNGKRQGSVHGKSGKGGGRGRGYRSAGGCGYGEVVVEDVRMNTVEVRCGSHPESSSSLPLQRKSSILHIWSFRFLDFCNLTPTFFLICL